MNCAAKKPGLDIWPGVFEAEDCGLKSRLALLSFEIIVILTSTIKKQKNDHAFHVTVSKSPLDNFTHIFELIVISVPFEQKTISITNIIKQTKFENSRGPNQ